MNEQKTMDTKRKVNQAFKQMNQEQLEQDICCNFKILLSMLKAIRMTLNLIIDFEKYDQGVDGQI